MGVCGGCWSLTASPLPSASEAALSKAGIPKPTILLGSPAETSTSREIAFTILVFHEGALRQELGRGWRINFKSPVRRSWMYQEGVSQPGDGAGNEEEFLAGTTSPDPGGARASRRQWCLGKAPRSSQAHAQEGQEPPERLPGAQGRTKATRKVKKSSLKSKPKLPSTA